MDAGRLAWCDVCQTSTLQYPEPIGEHVYWCCSEPECLTILGPIEPSAEGVQSET